MDRSASRRILTGGTWMVVRILVVALGLALISPLVATAAPRRTVEFGGEFHGSFATQDVGRSQQFHVHESGAGEAEPLGPFTYEAKVTQDLRKLPEGCGPFSSSGTQGSATMRFAEGELRLWRLSGEACFAFPFVDVAEMWQIASGTGLFRRATGRAQRIFHIDVRSGEVEGTWTGTLHFLDAGLPAA